MPVKAYWSVLAAMVYQDCIAYISIVENQGPEIDALQGRSDWQIFVIKFPCND